MRILKLSILLAALLGAMAPAPGHAQGGMMPGPGTPHSVGGGCSQATAYTGRVTTANAAILTTMICGMVTDGVWSTLDVFYLTATDTSGNALINLTSSSFPLTATGSPVFTVSSGYSGTAAAGQKLDSTYNFSSSSTNCTQNSCTVAGWSTKATIDNNCLIGDSTAGFTILMTPFNPSSEFQGVIAEAYPGVTSGVLGSGVGLFTMTRTGANASVLYQNSTSVATGTNASVALPNGTLQGLLCSGGTSFGGNIAAFAVASGWTPTQQSNFYARLHTALNAINATLFP